MKNDPKQYKREAVLAAVRKVVEYLWHDEGKHYHEQEEEEREGHIFEAVDLLAGWLVYQAECRKQEQRVLSLVVLLLATVLLCLPELLSYLN